MKAPVPVSFLIKLPASGLKLYKKRNLGTGVFLWILQHFEEHFFTEHIPKTASVMI